MTQLYKNGAVFIPAGITIEEVERIEKENKGLKRDFKSQFRKIAEQEVSRFEELYNTKY